MKKALTVFFLLTLAAASSAQKEELFNDSLHKKTLMTHKSPKMKVEIWSDIMCPFCYIGKRNYEAALRQFAGSDRIELEWHSFLLDPDIPDNLEKVSVYQYLAEKKRMSYEQSVKMHENVVNMARQAGLSYRFDIAVVANSFDAHRLIQLAKTANLGNEAEERLFSAYFTEGENISNHAVLLRLGQEIGLKEEAIQRVLDSDEFAYEVNQDVREAANLGISGVPFFIFDRKYAISGAQPPDVFLETLQKSFTEWEKKHPASPFQVIEGESCTPDGECK